MKVRPRRFVLDGKPVLLSTSYPPRSSSPAQPSPSKTPAPAAATPAFAELVHAPAHFRNDVRARMPQREETEALGLFTGGSPVVDIVRTAYTDAGQLEVNEMTLDANADILRDDLSA